MLFGGQYKKKGLLSGFPSGMQQMQPVEATMPAMGNPMAQISGNMDAMSGAMAPKKPGINWLGVLADTLAGAAGQPGPYAAQMQRKRDMEYAAQQQEQQREAGFADWQRRFAYQQEHAKPASPYRFEDNAGNVWELGQDGQPKRIFTDQAPKQYMVDGQFIQVANPYATGQASMGGADDWGDPVDTIPGGPMPRASGGFPVKADFNTFKRAVISQESGGRYGVANTEGSGAMGVGQVMPGTARTLAARAGLPYRPDLMAGNSPEARAYQDKITEGALKEAWSFGAGDPRRAAHYYFGGSDQKKWGAKTRRYGNDILGRLAKGGK